MANNVEEAVKWLIKAADQGDPEAKGFLSALARDRPELSNEGCTSVLNIDMSEDVKKKRLSKMKACAQCQRTQYCSKECTLSPSFYFPLLSFRIVLLFLISFVPSLSMFSLLVLLAGQKEHWKAGHKHECKKPAPQQTETD